MKIILSDSPTNVNDYARMNECELRDEITRLRRASRYIPQDVIDARIQLCQQHLDEIAILSERRAMRANPARYNELSRLLDDRQRRIDSTVAEIVVMEELTCDM